MEQLSLTIRQATESDAPRLHELHTSSVRTLCSRHYAAEIIDGWLQTRSPQGYLLPIQRGDIFVAEYGSTMGDWVKRCQVSASRFMSIRVPLKGMLALRSAACTENCAY